ncbi:hypothetical protein [Streptomyces canus]|uniref:hypothetical protein n=1 Tax=Streptomyces canus TaxID=58343 RepID=UPI00380B60F7
MRTGPFVDAVIERLVGDLGRYALEDGLHVVVEGAVLARADPRVRGGLQLGDRRRQGRSRHLPHRHPQWNRTDMPHPMGRIIDRPDEDDRVWVTTPHIKQFEKLVREKHLGAMPTIYDSWTGKYNESLFKPFYEATRKARTELVQVGGDPCKAHRVGRHGDDGVGESADGSDRCGTCGSSPESASPTPVVGQHVRRRPARVIASSRPSTGLPFTAARRPESAVDDATARAVGNSEGAETAARPRHPRRGPQASRRMCPRSPPREPEGPCAARRHPERVRVRQRCPYGSHGGLHSKGWS